MKLRKKTTRLILEKDEAIKRAQEHSEKESKYMLGLLKRQAHFLNEEKEEHFEIDSKLITAKEGIKRLLDRLKKSMDSRYSESLLTSDERQIKYFILQWVVAADKQRRNTKVLEEWEIYCQQKYRETQAIAPEGFSHLNVENWSDFKIVPFSLKIISQIVAKRFMNYWKPTFERGSWQSIRNPPLWGISTLLLLKNRIVTCTILFVNQKVANVRIIGFYYNHRWHDSSNVFNLWNTWRHFLALWNIFLIIKSDLTINFKNKRF